MADTAINLASPVQLDIIDGLCGLGISNFVACPSGKSSVLESFSGLPFPRASGLCTRFATQIIFRRSSTRNIKVSIIPGPCRSLQGTDKLRGYVKDGQTVLTSSPWQALETAQSTFSDDLLSIELCGPDKQNLSIIDIPGIFRTPTEGVTAVDDMALVRRIMNRHIKNERTIILAVIPSNTDIATQEILSIAKKLDPKGLRTLGVLTKPDLVDKEARASFRAMLLNASRKKRKSFAREPWSRLDQDRVGTPALQSRLQELLMGITRREFPRVQARLCSSLRPVTTASTDQQRRFLLEISHYFQNVTNCALDAYYSRHTVFSSVPELRIATLAVQRMERFAADIAALGHTVSFDSGPKEELVMSRSLTVSSTPSSDGSQKNTKDSDGDYPELSDLILTDRVAHEPSDRNIMDWIGEDNWAVDHVRFLIQVERFGTPMTMNHYFKDNLQKLKADRLEKLLAKHAEHHDTRQRSNVVRLDQIKQSMAIGNSEYAIQEIHDVLESYYTVARKRFVDTVCMQASDFFLLTGPESPLRVFGTAFVSQLSATQLDLIAGEDVSTKQLRKNLKNEIDTLEKGKKLPRA
ncbi:P-loop containing nucleoside triphosphate hydrolase protein [Bisporella sp. PMI_857]|nr:P-loop containing nucleoside triphosphate hydrolase protein [Bisporella sp. PMI_857]